MKAKAVLCGVVSSMFLAAGCYKPESKLVEAETQNLYDHLTIGQLKKVTVTRGPTMDLRPDEVSVASTTDPAFLSRLQGVLSRLPSSTGKYADIGRNTRTYRIELEGSAKSATLMLLDWLLALPGGDVIGAVQLVDLLEELLAAEIGDGDEPQSSFLERGLSVTVKPAKNVFAPKEALAFEVTFENVSDETFMLFDVDFYPWWRYRLTTVGGAAPGQKWEARFMSKIRRGPSEPVVMRPGESRVVKAKLDHRFMYVRKEGGRYTKDWTKHLPAGRYQVSIDRRLSEFVDWRGGQASKAAPSERKWPHPFWTGTIRMKPVEFQITAKGGAASAE